MDMWVCFRFVGYVGLFWICLTYGFGLNLLDMLLLDIWSVLNMFDMWVYFGFVKYVGFLYVGLFWICWISWFVLDLLNMSVWIFRICWFEVDICIMCI